MEAGFIELLSVLLSLSGFGVQANPNAPTSAEIMKYAPETADYAAYVDLEAVVPNNYRVFTALPTQPAVKAHPQALRAITQVVQEAEAGRSMIKQVTGFDPITDVKSAALWVTLVDAGDPEAIVAVRGSFAANLLDSIAASVGGGAIKKLAGGSALPSPDGKEWIALASDGTLLLGSASAVEQRLNGKWRTPRPRDDSARARFARMLDDKPFLAIGSSPGKSALRQIGKEMPDEDEALARDLLGGHIFAGLSLHADGVSWVWTDRSKAGYQRALLASEGMIDLFRAGHHGTRGLARVVLAGLGSYQGASPEIDAILRSQNQLLDLVTKMTGDGQFQAQVTQDAASRTVAVRARGKSLSDVVPVAGLLPIAGAGAFLALAREVEAVELSGPAAIAAPKAAKPAKATKPAAKQPAKPAAKQPAKPAAKQPTR
jgi:hypothetical protein